MKTLLSLIALLLALALLLCSCDLIGQEEPTDTEQSTEASTTPTNPNITPVPERDPVRYEWWLNDATELAIELDTQSNAALFYSLQTGYYTYYRYDECTYTKEGNTLLISIDDKTYTFTYNEADNTYSIKNSAADQDDLVYTRQSAQPTLHPVYSFPDFASLSFTSNVDLGDYLKDTIKSITLEEAGINIFLDYYSSSIETYPEVTDRPIRKGDYVNIDFIGYLNGTIIAGAGGTDQFLPVITRPEKIDNIKRVDDFINGLVGHTSGETFEIFVTFPENYSDATLAGKRTIFEITVNAIYDVDLTEEQLATYENLDFDTYEEYRESVAKAIVLEEGIPYLAQSFRLADLLPEASYLHFYQYYLDQAHYIAKRYYGETYTKYLELTGQSEAAMLAEAKQMATDFMLSYYIVQKYDLTWTTEQYEAQYNLMIDEYLNNGINKDQAVEELAGRMSELYAELTYQVASLWLVETIFAAES